MDKRNILALAITAASVAPMTVQAAGFQLVEHGAAGLGRAYAGEAAVADNASVLARNPAAGAFFKEKQISVNLHYIDPGVDVEGTNTAFNPAVPVADASVSDIAPTAVVPAAFYVSPINDKWSWGLS